MSHDLPRLRAESRGTRVSCSRCGCKAFDAPEGAGAVYVGYELDPVVYIGAPDGIRATEPVTCLECGREHRPEASVGRPRLRLV